MSKREGTTRAEILLAVLNSINRNSRIASSEPYPLEILLDAMDCINHGIYDRDGKYLIFGGTFGDLLDDVYEGNLMDAEYPSHDEKSNSIRELRDFEDTCGDVTADLRDARGRTVVDRKTTLDVPDQDQRPAKAPIERDEDYSKLLDVLKGHDPDGALAAHDDDYSWDLLDQYYAGEVLGKLTKIVRRVAELKALDIQGIPNERTRRYFAEAHRCYAYGFPLACAALCRAIIESALQETVDFRQSLQSPERVQPEKPDDSEDKLFRLVEQAKGMGLLSSGGQICAHDVRRAGNWAVHPGEFEKFKQRYGTEGVGEVVANTRKVLAELYGQAGVE